MMFQPTTFGKYFLTRRLAVGGSAEVYAAKLYGADGFEKDLVVKVILPQHARDPEFVAAFVREAKLAVTLQHANIVGVYELGRVDGTYFIALELVDGLDLFLLQEGLRELDLRLSVALACRIVEGAARGLEYAHKKKGPDGRFLGLVHRDLNPRNVLVSREGEIKVADFGIAKTQSEGPATQMGLVKGTPGYMSPEQAQGRPVDARTDIYQLGILLHELLTGVPLFWHPDPAELHRRLARPAPPPSKDNPQTPPALDLLVLQTLATDPVARPPSAAAWADQVAAARAGLPDPGSEALGALVAQILDRRTALVEDAAAAWPSTPVLGPTPPVKIETLAGRERSASFSGPASVPVAQVPASVGASVPTSVSVAALRPRRWPWGLLLLPVLGAAAWTLWPPVPVEVPAPEPPPLAVVPPPPPPLVPPPPPLEPPTKVIRPAEPTFATVAFGARPCSGRVRVDGEVVARSTPSFGHRLVAGKHRIVFEGTNCPELQAPGLLGLKQPRVVYDLELAPASRVKIIADFQLGKATVRLESPN